MDAGDFWFSKLSREFLSMQAEHFNNRRCDLPLYEVNEENNEIRCMIRTQPNTYIPLIVKKALGMKKGGRLELYDELRFNRSSEFAPMIYEAELVNKNNITKSSKVTGYVRCKSTGHRTCTLLVKIDIEVKITGYAYPFSFLVLFRKEQSPSTLQQHNFSILLTCMFFHTQPPSICTSQNELLTEWDI